jgi:hypothetical protein
VSAYEAQHDARMEAATGKLYSSKLAEFVAGTRHAEVVLRTLWELRDEVDGIGREIQTQSVVGIGVAVAGAFKALDAERDPTRQLPGVLR